MKKILIIGLFANCFWHSYGQSLTVDSQITSNSGGSYSKSGQFNLHWTMGENVVQVTGNNSLSLEQGFLHSDDSYELKKRVNLQQLGLEIYPNPSDGQIQLNFKREWNEKMFYYVFTIDGKNILSQSLLSDQRALNLTRLSKGTYFLRFVTLSGLYADEKIIIL